MHKEKINLYFSKASMNLHNASKDELHLNRHIERLPTSLHSLSQVITLTPPRKKKHKTYPSISSTPDKVTYTAFAKDMLKPKEVVLSIPDENAKVIVRSNISTFDKVFASINKTIHHSPTHHWSLSLEKQMASMSETLKEESVKQQQLSHRYKIQDRCVRFVQLGLTSANIFINTSAIDSSSIKTATIAINVLIGFCSGVEGIMNFRKRSYQHAEAYLQLDALHRTLRAQLILPPEQRREPTELLLFVENQRDKILKKLVNN